MQLHVQDQEEVEHGFEVIKHGKLALSSYYDILSDQPQEASLAQAAEEALIEEQQSVRQPNKNLEVWACAFSSEPHDYLAWSCGYGLLRILNVTSAAAAGWTSKHQRPIELDVGESVTALAFGSSASPLRHRRRTIKSGVYCRFCFDASENVLILAVGLSSGRIRIYDVHEARFLFGLFDHSALVCDLKFTQDGSLQLCSASADTTLKLWNMYDDGNMYMTLHGHVGWVRACDWSPVDNLLCSVGANRDAFIWSTQSYTILHRLKGVQSFH